MEKHLSEFQVAKMAEILKVSRSGYYAWLQRAESKRTRENKELLNKIKTIHENSNRVYGSIKIKHSLDESGETVNHKRIEQLMQKNDMRSKVARKFKATTNSKHNLPVAGNLLNREFTVEKPCEKMVSDITYIWTDEGWLYVAGIMDLCGQKIVGLSMDSRMTKELVIKALKIAYLRSGKPKGCIIHSDRGSQVRQEVA